MMEVLRAFQGNKPSATPHGSKPAETTQYLRFLLSLDVQSVSRTLTSTQNQVTGTIGNEFPPFTIRPSMPFETRFPMIWFKTNSSKTETSMTSAAKTVLFWITTFLTGVLLYRTVRGGSSGRA